MPHPFKEPWKQKKFSVCFRLSTRLHWQIDKTCSQGGLATASDLAAFRLSKIAAVQKSVNHSRTIASMRETGWEKQQEAHLRSDSTVWSEFAFIILVLLVITVFRLCRNQFFFGGNVELKFSFLLVLRLSLHAVYYAKNETSEHVPRCPTFWLCVSV